MDARLYAIIYLAGLQDINSGLYEAATVDGANRWQTFTRIVLSLSKASLATLAVLSFLTNWNDFLWPVYVLFTPKCLTLPPRLAILPSA
jgi:multiple sugar transport system permease protein